VAPSSVGPGSGGPGSGGLASAGRRLLTAREVQDRLQVDATTIYRMAADGRLPAVKVGRQWRFPADGVDDLLAGAHSPRTGHDQAPTSGRTVANHRVHNGDRPIEGALDPASVEAVLDVSAPMLGVMMVVTDMEGNPVSSVANPCPWFVEHADDAETLEACTAEWRAMADDLDFAPHFQHAELGFECARAFIRSGSELIGQVLAGGVAAEGDETDGLFHLTAAQRQAVLDNLPRVSVALSKATQAHQAVTQATPAHRTPHDRTTPATTP
jgi:excisionase family DNA binding protein